jgi:hypothetical protein
MWFIKTLSVLAISALAFTALALAEPKQSATGGALVASTAKCGNHTAQGHRWVLKLRGSSSIPKWAKRKHKRAVRCAASPAHRKVIRSQWKRVQRSLLPENHDLWIRIGRCEQPGSGYKGVNWSHTGPTYQGGLGMWYGNWTSLKPSGFPSNAGYASWRQQMKVANKLASIYGFSAWGCY